MKHLFECIDELEAARADKHLLLMLDFDGTLAPIAPTPNEATLSGETRRLLEGLSKRPAFTVAIVSGRSLGDVRAKVEIEDITYVGNHGLEYVRPGEEPHVFEAAGRESLPKELREDLARALSPFAGVIIEDKGFSLGVHYRTASREDRPRVKEAVREIVRARGGGHDVEIEAGAMVLELRPPVDCDKGTIVSRLLEMEARRRAAGTFAIYLGDDATDEDAFKAVRGHGWPVLVGTPRISHARYYLNDPGEVRELLAMLLAGGEGAR